MRNVIKRVIRKRLRKGSVDKRIARVNKRLNAQIANVKQRMYRDDQRLNTGDFERFAAREQTLHNRKYKRLGQVLLTRGLQRTVNQATRRSAVVAGAGAGIATGAVLHTRRRKRQHRR